MKSVAAPSHASSAASYSQARRRLGAAAVGTMVVFSAALLWFDAGSWFSEPSSPGDQLAQLLAVLAIHGALLLPFEVAGGLLLPRAFGVEAPSNAAFFGSWLRGWLPITAFVLTFGMVFMTAFAAFGPLGAMACAGAGAAGMIALQGLVARATGIARVPAPAVQRAALAEIAGVSEDRIWVARADATAFVGGWVGLPGREVLVVPEDWLNALPEPTRHIALLRRRGALETGGRALGVSVAAAWTLLGLAIVAWTTGADLSQPGGLVTLWLGFTLWSFAGVLTLPTLSRAGVYAVDTWVRNRGTDEMAFAEALRTLDARQGDEVTRTPTTETIFHPVPSLESRLQPAAPGGTWPGAWQGARVALYLGWLGGGLLSRAVHCNCGRPAVWVLYPGD